MSNLNDVYLALIVGALTGVIIAVIDRKISGRYGFPYFYLASGLAGGFGGGFLVGGIFALPGFEISSFAQTVGILIGAFVGATLLTLTARNRQG